MKQKIISLITVLALITVYIVINAIASNCPDEPAFVFCSIVFTQYVDLVIYIHDLSDQFSLLWSWQH